MITNGHITGESLRALMREIARAGALLALAQGWPVEVVSELLSLADDSYKEAA